MGGFCQPMHDLRGEGGLFNSLGTTQISTTDRGGGGYNQTVGKQPKYQPLH